MCATRFAAAWGPVRAPGAPRPRSWSGAHLACALALWLPASLWLGCGAESHPPRAAEPSAQAVAPLEPDSPPIPASAVTGPPAGPDATAPPLGHALDLPAEAAAVAESPPARGETIWPEAAPTLEETVAPEAAPPRYRVHYEARLVPADGLARVTIWIEQEGGILRSIRLGYDADRHSDFRADGALDVAADKAFWIVPEDGGELSFTVRVNRPRETAGFRSRMTEEWAIFRGEHIFPPMASQADPASEADATLRFRLPKGWQIVAPYTEAGRTRYEVEQPHRQLDQPRGWIVAGKLQVARSPVAGMDVQVAVPSRFDFHPAGVLALLRLVGPTLQDLLGRLPPQLLVVAAGDPMWRGGLSGPRSLYIHTARPLVQRDGTSPLLHELIHVVTHAHSGHNGDWIVEGLAEYYSTELLARSGIITEAERTAALHALRKRGERAKDSLLIPGESRGARTARAVAILDDLNRALLERSGGEASLDDVLRHLAASRTRVTVESFLEATRIATGQQMGRFLRGRIGETPAQTAAR